MLKQRQDGLVFLHGLLLDGLIIALFAGLATGFQWRGWMQPSTGFNGGIHLLGVVIAMLWNHRALPVMAGRLGTLTFRETIRLTGQQLCRLMAVLFAVGFVAGSTEISRAFIATFVALAAGALLAANFHLPRRLAAQLFRASEMRTLVLAPGPDASRLQAWLAERSHLGQRVAGCVLPAGESAPADLKVLGGVGDLRRILGEQHVNQVIVHQGRFSAGEMAHILEEAAHAACRVRHFIDLRATFGEDMNAVECNEHYAFGAEASRPLDNPLNSLLKRALDLAVAIPLVCVVLPPLIIMVWLAQRRQSPGPVFYRQERSGLNRRRFQILKFRTMHTNADLERNRQATRTDERVFRFGRFLRQTSLDEFPQFLNVLSGDMSVSGPRPHLLEHDREFAAIVGSYHQRHFVKPGITGLAQSEGFRGEVAGRPELLKQRIARDLRYVRMWSLELDLKIIALTAAQVVRPPRAAY